MRVLITGFGPFPGAPFNPSAALAKALARRRRPAFADVDEAEYTAVTYGLATVISGSYGSVEFETAESVISTENLINEVAAIQGISANFATGDDGDFSVEIEERHRFPFV